VRQIADVEPETFLRYAAGSADAIHSDLEQGRRLADEIRDDLRASGTSLRECRTTLEELGQVPGGQTQSAAELYQRLDGLQRAVSTAKGLLEQADHRLRSAQENVETLRNPALHASRAGAEQLITQTHADVAPRTGRARSNVQELSEGLDGVQSDFRNAAAHSIDLAHPAQIGLNPTPPSQQVAARLRRSRHPPVVAPGNPARA
jgi:ABC-type transporter Mla subunit MlaD